MTVERDIVGFALPFTVGTAISVCIFHRISQYGYLSATIALAIASIALPTLIYSTRTRLNHNLIWLSAIVAAVCSGYISAITDLLTSSPGSGDQHLSSIAASSGSRLKELIMDTFEKTEAKHLITALITGDRSGLSSELTESFRRSGASHILALSGLHLGIIYGALRRLLCIFGNSRRSRISKSVIIISFCVFYTFATGAGPSITRALLFIILNETAVLCGRHRSTRNVLWTALTLQLIFEPSSIKDIGFQLSYAAMSGIAYIYPTIKSAWPDRTENEGVTTKSLRWIWNSAAMSISCQLTTGPLAWIYFETFPFYFLITNLIAIPLASIIIPACLTATLLNICGICPDFMITAIDYAVSLLTRSLDIIASL